MTNQDNNPDRPLVKYQEFLDAHFGSFYTQTIEERHASIFLEAVDHAEQGNYIEAVDLFIRASNTAPTEAGKLYCQALVKEALGAYDVYENALANAASEMRGKEAAKVVWNPLKGNLSVYLSFLGIYCSERKKYSESIQYYDRAIKINPNYAMAYFSRGCTKADLYIFDEAVQDLTQAVELFHDQNDLPNSQKAKKTLFEIIKIVQQYY